MEQVIVLNSDYTFLNTVTVERAFLYITKGKVYVEKYAERVINTAGEVFRIPKIVRFVRLIEQVFKKRVPWSKHNVLIRDNHTCQYCGTKKGLITVDHVVPKSRGGANSFLNCVAACFECNNHKDDRTPDEAGMKLRREPYVPTIKEFMLKKPQKVSDEEIMKELGFK